jgi:hypothetical protein
MLTFRPDTFRRAVIETVVIAVGVFVALAADNWNEDRKDRQLEQQFLEGVALDLTVNSERIRRVEAGAEIYKGSLERMIEALRTGQATWDSPEAFVTDLVYCTYLGTPRLSSVAFDELQSTGSMRLIQDSEFKRKLADYYAFFQHHSQHHPEYRRKEAALEESLLGFLPLVERIEISDSNGVRETGIDVQETIRQLQQIPDLVARLEDLVWVQHRMLTRYHWIFESGDDLLQDIDAMRR